MMDKQINALLINYHAFVAQVDQHILKVETAFHHQIKCRKGCDECCRRLTFFPVEALAVSLAFSQLPLEIKKKIPARAAEKSTTCPLLIDHQCAIYKDRPIICRTHGFPIYMDEGTGSPRIDFCPRNFYGMTDFSGDMLLSVRQLNTTLSAINQVFIKTIQSEPPLPERLDIFESFGLGTAFC